MPDNAAIYRQNKAAIWREPQFWLLLAMVLAIFASRPTALSIRGEESRWARVAVEMLESGDVVTPRQQGMVFPDRPPLGSWLIALSMRALGSHGALAVRLPAILSTALMTLLIYGYARSWQSAWGAWMAGAAFATCGQTLQLGGLAESEAVYTLCLGGGLIVWSWGYENRWHPALYWVGGYVLLALATLCKGIQAPVYFMGGVTAFLLLRRDWRSLFSAWHFSGMALATLIVMAWLVPFGAATSRETAWQSLFGLSLNRMQDVPLGMLVKHCATFPGEFLAAMLPWSLLLFVYARREVRRDVASRGGQAMFLGVCIVLSLLTCLAAVNARPRYLMPLIPAVAALVGAVADLAFGRVRLPEAWFAWKLLARAMAIIMPLAGLGFLVTTLALSSLSEPSTAGWWTAGGLVAISLVAAVVAWRSTLPTSRLPGWCAGLAMVVFLGWGYTAAATQWLVQDSPDSALAVAKLREQLPRGVQLVSLESIHHPFAYHYDETIAIHPWPSDSSGLDPAVEYFCFSHSHEWTLKEPPFAWEKLAEIPCDRSHRSKVGRVVIVGRRLRESTTTANDAEMTELPTHRGGVQQR